MCGSHTLVNQISRFSSANDASQLFLSWGLFGWLRNALEFVAFSKTMVSVAKLNWKSLWIVFLFLGLSVPFSCLLYLVLLGSAVVDFSGLRTWPSLQSWKPSGKTLVKVLRLQFGIRRRANKATFWKHSKFSYNGDLPFESRHLIVTFVHKVEIMWLSSRAVIRMCCYIGNI